MLDAALKALCEGIRNDRPVTLRRIALVTQQRNGAGEAAREGVEERAQGAQVFPEVHEVARQIPVFAQPMANVPRRAQRALMLIFDSNTGEQRGEGALGEAPAARERKLTHVKHARDSRAPERCDKAVDSGALVANREDAWLSPHRVPLVCPAAFYVAAASTM